MPDSHKEESQKRVFERVRGYPGVFKVLVWNPEKGKHVDPRSIAGCSQLPFRAMRRVRVLGKSIQQCKHFDSVHAARAWMLEPKPEVQARLKDAYTMKQLIDDWVESTKPPVKTLSKWQCDQNKLKHFAPLFDVPVEELRATDIDQWLQYVMAPTYPKKLSRTSFLMELKVLNAMLNWYRDWKNEKYQSPVLRHHRRNCWLVRQPIKRGRAMSLEELEAVLERLRGHHKPVYYYLASFQALTGVRIGEACGLVWESVDLDRGIVEICRICEWDHFSRRPALHDRTKSGKSRLILLPPRAIEVLKEWKSRGTVGPLVFHKGDGQPLHYPAIQNCYNKAFVALGLPYRSTHVFRHTFARWHSHQTGNLRATQSAMGHGDLKITQHYAPVDLATQEQAMGDFELGKIKNPGSPVSGVEPKSSTEKEGRIVH